jgi:hypothetical protein
LTLHNIPEAIRGEDHKLVFGNQIIGNKLWVGNHKIGREDLRNCQRTGRGGGGTVWDLIVAVRPCERFIDHFSRGEAFVRNIA